MLAIVDVKENEVNKYKQETFIPAGKYYRFFGASPNEQTKKRLQLMAVNKGGAFMWLCPCEPWVKRFVDGQIDPIPALVDKPDWSMFGRVSARNWQKRLIVECYNYLRNRLQYRKGWVAPLGAGKTLAGLMVSQFFNPNETAVLARRYLHETWKSQAAEWSIPTPIIATYESCHKLPDSIKCLIIDECIELKNDDAQRTVRAQALSKRCEVVLGFTGIPIAGGGPPDWRWLRSVNPGCVPADIKAWQFAWGVDTQLKEVGPNKAYVTTEWRTDEITRFINPFVHTVDIAEIVSEMPEVTYNYIYCPAPVEYPSIQAGAGTTRGVHKKLAQALQATDGFIYNDEEQPVRINSPKLQTVKEWADTLNEPVILVAAWTDTITQLSQIFQEEWPAVLSGSTADPGREIERFKSGHTRVLIANASYSKGMNLQKVCRVMGVLSVSSKPDDLAQMVGRIARPGQKDGVQINFFCCEDSLDKRRIELVQKHQDCSADFIEKLLLEELK